MNVTRPLASAKVKATGKSYSDHEALEVDLELSISDNKKSNTASESKERVSCKKQLGILVLFSWSLLNDFFFFVFKQVKGKI